MQESIYPVPQGPGYTTPPSRLLASRTDPAVDKPSVVLQGKFQPLLTVGPSRLIPFVAPVIAIPVIPFLQGKLQIVLSVRSPVLFQPPLPAGIALTSKVVLRGRPQDLLIVRSPFLIPLIAAAPVLTSNVIIRGRVQIEAGRNERSPNLFKFNPPVIIVSGNLIYIPTFRPRRR
jgi:hypothetical protein